MIQKGYKYRIYPNKQQEEFLMKSFGCARFIYNFGLAKKNQEYANNKKSINYYSLNTELNKLKKEKEWLTEVNSQSLQMALRNLDNAFTKFFREKKGFPKFKSKNKNDFSFQMPQHVSIYENKLYIPKVSEGIKIKLSREFKGKIKTTTISKNAYDQFFVTLLVESEEECSNVTKKVNSKTTIGIDLGIKDFAVFSNGERIANPRHLKNKLRKLKKIQRRHSRKVKGSNNRKKNRLILAHLHLKIKNQRGDFLHKLTHDLTHKKQVDTIVIEDLAVANMIKNHCLARAISDVGWGEFRRQLEYKCKWYGKNLIVIGRFEPSSKLCSNCGTINSELKLSDREWICSCGVKHDRDLLAANNIKNFGLTQYRRNYGNLHASGDVLVA